MLAFWAIVAVFIIVTLILLLPPLLRHQEVKGVVARKDLTVTVYQDQFEELENDLKNGTISEEQHKLAKIDLEKNLLEDIDKATQLDDVVAIKSPMSNKILAAFILVCVPLTSIGLYDLWGRGVEAIAPESIPEEVRLAQQQHNQQESIDAMVQQLTEKLDADPSDGESWFMLARTYAFLKRFDESVAAYEKTLPLGGNESAEVLSSYADAVAMASGRNLTKKAVSILEQAIQLDPNHIKSLWLLGTAAYQKQEFRGALKYWEKLYTLMEPGSDDAIQISSSVNEIRSRLGMPPMDVSKIQTTPPAETNEEISDARIQGSVSLADDMTSEVSANDTVFVFARAASGSRMPLAIIRKQVKDMPFDFTLDDSLAMNPSMKLSSVPEVIVSARISKSGDAMPQAGDLQGVSSILSVTAADPVALVIDTIIQ